LKNKNLKDYIREFTDFFNNENFIEAEQIALLINKKFSNYSIGFKALASVWYKIGKIDKSIWAFQKTLEITPEDFEVYNNLGLISEKLNKLDQAAYYFEQSIKFKKDFVEAYFNLGNVLVKKGCLKESIYKYKEAIKLNKNFFWAYINLGHTLSELGNFKDAINYYKVVLSAKPDHAIVRSSLINNKKKINDFSVEKTLETESSKLGITTEAINPFMPLTWQDNPEQQFLRAQNYAFSEFGKKKIRIMNFLKKQSKIIKIGYFSADFYNFAGMHLLSGVFENHDRDQFEVYAFSYGPYKDDYMRKKIKSSVDYFIDLDHLPNDEITKIVHDKNIDIAINRNGYTKNSRTEIFQSRLSPIQINYLGYPGTLGTNFMDYIIADHVVIPTEQRQFYSEKIIFLPHSYQPNDNKRKIDQDIESRTHFNLPKDGFVFCCFNQNYKITSKEFNIWLRLLKKVKGSVLWLLKPNHEAVENLLNETQLAGVNPNRIVFANKVSPSKHLARHKYADLFVDTFNVNAHTTASDALWAGLPVITKIGKQFAARVAASLLKAIDMPELIAKTEDEYEKLILELALNPEKLAKVKSKLLNNKLNKPLFDTKLYTANLENGFKIIYKNLINGVKPKDIEVKSI
jgi:protein O-GlcNAc transferase